MSKPPERVSPSQVIAMVVLSRLSLTLMYYGVDPQVKQDVWWENIFDALLTMLGAWGLSFLWRRFPQQTLIQVTKRTLGRVAGTFVAALQVLFLLLSLSLTLRVAGEIFITVSLPATPIIIVIGLLAAAGAYGVRAGLEAIGRAAEVVFPILVVSVIGVFTLMSGSIRLDQLLPFEILATGPIPHFKSMVGVVGRTVELIVVGMLVPFCHPHENMFATVAKSLAWLAVVWVFMSVEIFGVLTGDIQAYPFPWLMAVRSAEMFGVGRVDALVLAAWVLGIFIRISFLLWAVTLGTAQCFGLRRYRFLALPVAGIATTYAIAQADSLPEMLHYMRSEVFTPFTLFFTILIPMGVLLIAVLRGMRGQTAETHDAGQ